TLGELHLQGSDERGRGSGRLARDPSRSNGWAQKRRGAAGAVRVAIEVSEANDQEYSGAGSEKPFGCEGLLGDVDSVMEMRGGKEGASERPGAVCARPHAGQR